MTLWIVLTSLTLAIMALVLFPLLRKQTAEAQRVDYDVVVYRDQLTEVDKDVERGILTADQAEPARGEIYRRMLAAEDAEHAVTETGVSSGSGRSKIILAAVLLIAVPLGAGLTYLYLGSPELPSKPYAARQNDSDFIMATEAERLAVQLDKTPDAVGYRRLADTYFTLRRFDKAVEAYQVTIQMTKKPDASLYSELGEAIAMSRDDLVVPEARQAFVKALRIDPRDARSRFYLGLSETQIGEPRRAVAIWRDLEKDSAPDAPWLGMVKEHIASFAKEGGFDPASVTPMKPSLNSPHDVAVGVPAEEKPTAAMDGATSGSSRDAASAIMAMKPDDQDSMIRKMVGRLADKMKNNPNDIDGWARLATAYRVLGEDDKAKEAEGKVAALKAKAGN